MLFFDVELFEDLMLVGFLNEEGRYKAFTDPGPVARLVNNRRLVGYNSQNYDLPVIEAFIQGASLTELNQLSKAIVTGDRVWAKKRYDHIDLMQVAPALKISLKLYAGRMHFPTMHEIEFDKTPPRSVVEAYNLNDLRVTEALYHRIKDKIDLREKMVYKTSMISRSDAQIAEHTLRELIPDFEVPVVKPGTRYRYKRPSWLKPFGAVDTAWFEVGPSGAVLLPDDMKKAVIIGGKPYAMGIGGLHSKESNVYVEDVTDWDVTSFYPNIIMMLGLFPEGLGSIFLHHYKKIVDDRVTAKRQGDKVKNETLKIVINGAFGKLGSKYSCLYSPQLLIQVTVTGQLVLLNLIDYLTGQGLEVISANTDGIVVKGNAGPFIQAFELQTGFEFESNHYTKYFGRDVNNYVAIKDDGSIKTKGTFSPAGLTKNPDNEIIGQAVIQELLNPGTGQAHIASSMETTAFLQVRTVRGGGTYQDEYLGKVVRYYHSKSSPAPLTYKTNGNKVPKSDGCRPLMNLEDMDWDDLDRDWYIKEFEKCVKAISKGNTAEG